MNINKCVFAPAREKYPSEPLTVSFFVRAVVAAVRLSSLALRSQADGDALGALLGIWSDRLVVDHRLFRCGHTAGHPVVTATDGSGGEGEVALQELKPTGIPVQMKVKQIIDFWTCFWNTHVDQQFPARHGC